MNLPLSKEAHIAIRYAIMHAYKEKLDPQKKDYTIQVAPKCEVCDGHGTAYGIECTELHDVDPGDHMFHYVCSHCFSQLVICTDHVSFNITNIGYINTATGEILYYCSESQYPKGTEYQVRGRSCERSVYVDYLSKIKQIALANRNKRIADSRKFFEIEEESVARPNFPLN